MASRLLDPQTLATLQSLRLELHTTVQGALQGHHRAPHFGSSIEFAEYKEYSPGDEIRHIDWKAYGKWGKYYVKRFERQTELCAHLIIDCSGSMGYKSGGRPSKLEYAQRLAAQLAYLLIAEQDRVGLLAFSEATLAYVPPRGQARHLGDLLGVLETFAPAGKTNLPGALDALSERLKRLELVVIFSDLFGSVLPTLGRLKELRARGQQVVLFHLLDPDEIEFPFDAECWFESMESSDRLLCDAHALRQDYQVRFRSFLDQWKDGATAADFQYLRATTDEPQVDVLVRFLKD